MRKPVQISIACGNMGNQYMALCDDGSMWWLNGAWEQLPPIPQDDAVEPDGEMERLRKRAAELEAAVIQLRGALILDHMVDGNGQMYGTTSVALRDAYEVLPEGK